MVLDILNEWDPLNVLNIAPKDEYETTAQTIEKMINEKKSKIEIGSFIYDYFGFDDFNNVSIEKCIKMADKMIKAVN